MAAWNDKSCEPKAPDKLFDKTSGLKGTVLGKECSGKSSVDSERKQKDDDNQADIARTLDLGPGEYEKLLEDLASPRYQEGKSDLAKKLLQKADSEAEEDVQRYEFIRSHRSVNLKSRRGCAGAGNRQRGGSLQNINQACHPLHLFGSSKDYPDSRPPRRRRHKDNQVNDENSVSSRQREGGSLPANVNAVGPSLQHVEERSLPQASHSHRTAVRSYSFGEPESGVVEHAVAEQQRKKATCETFAGGSETAPDKMPSVLSDNFGARGDRFVRSDTIIDLDGVDLDAKRAPPLEPRTVQCEAFHPLSENRCGDGDNSCAANGDDNDGDQEMVDLSFSGPSQNESRSGWNRESGRNVDDGIRYRRLNGNWIVSPQNSQYQRFQCNSDSNCGLTHRNLNQDQTDLDDPDGRSHYGDPGFENSFDENGNTAGFLTNGLRVINTSSFGQNYTLLSQRNPLDQLYAGSCNDDHGYGNGNGRRATAGNSDKKKKVRTERSIKQVQNAEDIEGYRGDREIDDILTFLGTQDGEPDSKKKSRSYSRHEATAMANDHSCGALDKGRSAAQKKGLKGASQKERQELSEEHQLLCRINTDGLGSSGNGSAASSDSARSSGGASENCKSDDECDPVEIAEKMRGRWPMRDEPRSKRKSANEDRGSQPPSGNRNDHSEDASCNFWRSSSLEDMNRAGNSDSLEFAAGVELPRPSRRNGGKHGSSGKVPSSAGKVKKTAPGCSLLGACGKAVKNVELHSDSSRPQPPELATNSSSLDHQIINNGLKLSRDTNNNNVSNDSVTSLNLPARASVFDNPYSSCDKIVREQQTSMDVAMPLTTTFEESGFLVVSKRQRRKPKNGPCSLSAQGYHQGFYHSRTPNHQRNFQDSETGRNISHGSSAFMVPLGDRRKSTSSVPPSEHSDSSDVDSVHSLPVVSTTPKLSVSKTSTSTGSTPQASYADIAKMSSSLSTPLHHVPHSSPTSPDFHGEQMDDNQRRGHRQGSAPKEVNLLTDYYPSLEESFGVSPVPSLNSSVSPKAYTNPSKGSDVLGDLADSSCDIPPDGGSANTTWNECVTQNEVAGGSPQRNDAVTSPEKCTNSDVCLGSSEEVTHGHTSSSRKCDSCSTVECAAEERPGKPNVTDSSGSIEDEIEGSGDSEPAVIMPSRSGDSENDSESVEALDLSFGFDIKDLLNDSPSPLSGAAGIMVPQVAASAETGTGEMTSGQVDFCSLYRELGEPTNNFNMCEIVDYVQESWCKVIDELQDSESKVQYFQIN